MANTGNVFPGTGENNAGIGATAWTNPGNVVSDNATDATCNAAASSQYLVARNFGFTLPAGSTINGVTVRIEASEHSGGTESLNARLQDDSGTLIGSSKAQTISGTTKAVYTYGSTSDLWGATLNTTIVNDADFGVRFWFTTAHDVRIDFVTVAIEYTEPFRRAQVSWAEFEVPNAPRRTLVSWAEFEVPNAPRRALVSWAELELPNAPRRTLVSWAEFEVPDAPTNNRRCQVSWAEFEIPTAPRRILVSWSELELPNAPRRIQLSWAEFEIPDVLAPGGGGAYRPRYRVDLHG